MNKKVIIVLFVVFILFLLGDSANDALETQNNGATMCMACIGLE
ncbi:MAG: hypothetical protein WCO69_00420 [Candidatus Omnitrophota bacterium]